MIESRAGGGRVGWLESRDGIPRGKSYHQKGSYTYHTLDS